MSYAGDLTVNECWKLLGESDNAILVDVRTVAEWSFVGLPLLAAGMRDIILQQWQMFPEMNLDVQFVDRLTDKLAEAGADTETVLCFLCRSGVRSLSAAQAMAAAGYAQSYNISGGFEGDPDENGHRGKRNGWKAEGLPWRQS